MKTQIFYSLAIILCVQYIQAMVIESSDNGEQLLHFGFKTENGQSRTEDITYNNTILDVNTEKADDNELNAVTTAKPAKPVEYRGGYSFISADGYEYTVLYKANKNGFQPYVTARKIRDDKI
ncbi:PREDICTED: endocuticle structural protein SgAbd-6 [Rhagoletis zephyria]|uniref:endocuticle structural protein SgAbd-6 n=1 Tax=Rhagoletis zephyria TaxID=28612 RepID=UPI0008114BC3|nr:PREDICTED: endocuticle structural protein SgAbd-6 [Rhagoletis zephyria]